MDKFVKKFNGQFELDVDKIDSPLWNKDLSSIPIASRTWTKWTMTMIWVTMSINIPTYMLGSSLIGSGMNWWQSILTIALGNIIVLIPMSLIAHAGPKYGVPFPVLIRSSFGTQGAKLIAMMRAFVACGWLGINLVISGNALYIILAGLLPFMKNSPYLGNFIGLDFWHLTCILIMMFVQMLIVRYGMGMVKKVEVYASPFLLALCFFLFIWAWWKAGSIENIFKASAMLSKEKNIDFWLVFWPGLTAIVGYWATLALNIPDFTRFVKSQKDQIIGQAIGMPPTMAFISFIGIAVTSVTVIVFGTAIWDPVQLIGKFDSSFLTIIPLIGLIVASVCVNIAASVVSSANDFSNLLPRHIDFRIGGYISCIIGFLIFPWKLIADPHGYIFRWLIAYSALLGAVGGVMIVDYYIVRKTFLNLKSLFSIDGEYTYTNGWNLKAFFAIIVGTAPNMPGFLVQVGLIGSDIFPQWIDNLYNYAWFISFFIAFVVYLLLTKKNK